MVILNPPGGLDQNGHARFQHHVSYFVYFGCAEFAQEKPRRRVYLTVNMARDAARIRKIVRHGFMISDCLHCRGLDNYPDPGEEYLHGPDQRNIGCGFENGRLDPCLCDGAVKL